MAEEQQVLVRLGMDGSSFSQGLRSGLAGLNQFGQEGERSFLHVGSAGRAFHKVLEQVR